MCSQPLSAGKPAGDRDSGLSSAPLCCLRGRLLRAWGLARGIAEASLFLNSATSQPSVVSHAPSPCISVALPPHASRSRSLPCISRLRQRQVAPSRAPCPTAATTTHLQAAAAGHLLPLPYGAGPAPSRHELHPSSDRISWWREEEEDVLSMMYGVRS